MRAYSAAVVVYDARGTVQELGSCFLSVVKQHLHESHVVAWLSASMLVSIMHYNTSQRILYAAQSETEHVHNIKPLCPTRRLIRADASI